MKLSLIVLVLISIKLWQVSACKSKDIEGKFSEEKNSTEIAEVQTLKNSEIEKRNFSPFNGLSGKLSNFLYQK